MLHSTLELTTSEQTQRHPSEHGLRRLFSYEDDDNMSSLITLVPHMVSVAYPRVYHFISIFGHFFDSIDSSSNSAVTVEIGNFGLVLKIS